MAYTQADLDAIDAAIKSGSLTVEYQDRRKTFRSLDDLIRIKALILESLSGNASASGGGRIFQGSRTSKGLGAGSRRGGSGSISSGGVFG